MRIFGRQRGHFLVRHVRRIADDQVVALARQAREQIRMFQLHPLADMETLHVVGGQLERLGTDVHRVDLPFGIVHGHCDRDTARTGAQVECAFDFQFAQPGIEARLDQFGDRRTRHQCARIALETQPGKPCFPGEIRDRDALLDAAREQRHHFGFFLLGHARLAIHRVQIVRQVQTVQHQLGRLVQRVVVTVAEREPGSAKAAGAVADQVDDGREFGGHAQSNRAAARSIAAAIGAAPLYFANAHRTYDP